jgi:hypothetical protein
MKFHLTVAEFHGTCAGRPTDHQAKRASVETGDGMNHAPDASRPQSSLDKNSRISRLLLRLPDPRLLKDWGDIASALIPMFYRLSFAAGVLIVVLYCLAQGILPRQFSFGDAAVFVFVLIALAIIWGVGLLYGTFATVWAAAATCAVVRIWKRWRKRHDLEHDRIDRPKLRGPFASLALYAASLCVFLIFLWLCVLLWDTKNETKFGIVGLIAIFAAAGWWLLAAFVVERESGTTVGPVSRIFVFTLVVLATPFLMAGTPLLNLTMASIGLRWEAAHNRVIIVSGANFLRLQEAAASTGVALKECPPTANGDRLVMNVEIAWHGVGTIAYVRLLDRQSATEALNGFVTVELNDAEVWPIRGTGKVSCPAR